MSAMRRPTQLGHSRPLQLKATSLSKPHSGQRTVYATMLATTAKWRGIRMDAFTSRLIDELRDQVFTKPEMKAA
jgi:hypothetical protein